MAHAKAHAKKPVKRHLKAVSSHPDEQEKRGGTVSDLFSGKVTRAAPKAQKGKRKAKPTEVLPPKLQKLSDLYAAGKVVQKELSFKVRFAEEQVKEYCSERFAQIYAAGGKRPPSIEYSGAKSRFLFTQTNRTTLTLEKVDELKSANVPIDDYTELRGIRINYEAIRRHGLEKKLQNALGNMGISKDILEECFLPNIELVENFFEVLDNVARDSLQPGETLESKVTEIMKILRPANQIRNLEIPGLSAEQCFNLVMHSAIEVPEEESEEEEEVA